jgi:uncharacterized protein (TIGR02145 family)
MKAKNLFLLPALAFFACATLQAQVTIGGVTDPAPGAIVYHTGGNDIPAGIYIWNGKWWMPAGGCSCPSGTLADSECNCYTIAEFGAAGTWMTQNLRSTDVTYESIGTSIPLVEKSTITGSTTEPRYTYPRVAGSWSSISEADRDSVFRAHKHYGLFYNWVAAYSDITLGDGRMKSVTPVDGVPTNGSSFSHDKGGFDALLVGNVHGDGEAASYGSTAYFWSSSSSSSLGVSRYLQFNSPVLTQFTYSGIMVSVRCKKN